MWGRGEAIEDLRFLIEVLEKDMQKITVNELRSDGMRRLRVMGDSEVDSAWWVEQVPAEARSRVVTSCGTDWLLGLHWLEVLYPIFEPFAVQILNQKKFRRLMFVHYAYGSRVSECIEMGRREFEVRAGFVPNFAFVKDVPDELDGSERGGCILLRTEWMPARCAAVGG